MAEIQVRVDAGDVYRVRVTEGGRSTEHRVTATPDQVEAFGGGATPETLIGESFLFLLEREPKESLLRSFELPVIARYFPEYPEVIRKRLSE